MPCRTLLSQLETYFYNVRHIVCLWRKIKSQLLTSIIIITLLLITMHNTHFGNADSNTLQCQKTYESSRCPNCTNTCLKNKCHWSFSLSSNRSRITPGSDEDSKLAALRSISSSMSPVARPFPTFVRSRFNDECVTTRCNFPRFLS